MSLERLRPTHVREAVGIYLEHAWPGDKPGKPRLTPKDLEDAQTLEELSGLFERRASDEDEACERLTLRLGNYRYPFMKFVVEEYLVAEEYFFAVDTHDDLRITPDMPDYAGWCELCVFNRELKAEIESAWRAAGLPTYEHLRELMEGIARQEADAGGAASAGAGVRGDGTAARLLVADDEQEVARGLEALLGARGYEVEVAFDGRQVLERLERDPLPDLVVLDYSMPELDGEEVMRRLRQNPRYAGVRILLATATEIDLAALPPASGFLRKPYPRELLFTMIRQLLA